MGCEFSAFRSRTSMDTERKTLLDCTFSISCLPVSYVTGTSSRSRLMAMVHSRGTQPLSSRPAMSHYRWKKGEKKGENWESGMGEFGVNSGGV